MSVTTKMGDDGTTELIGGKRVSKDHPAMECLGSIDELNAFLGDAKCAAEGRTAGIIQAIQKELFVIAGILAGSMGKAPDEKDISALIDELEAKQPPMTTFAIPGATAASAKLHIARTVCRRAERALVRLGRMQAIPKGEHGEEHDRLDGHLAGEHNRLLSWFNRLSDLLFLLAQEEAGGLRK